MAESLVQELRANRQFSRALRRPIVFVCHGFGGVLVKKSLLYSSTRTATKVVHLWDMYISTFAIIFLGTPHGQTNKANWLELDAMARGLRPSSTLLSSRSKYAEMEDAPQELRMGEAQEIGGFGFDVRLELPFRSSGGQPKRPTPMRYFHIPEETDPTYIGREDLLQGIRSAFFAQAGPGTPPGPRSFVVFGMGGSGKTSLYSKFATENKHEYVHLP